MNSPTSISPMDCERCKPPSQHLKGTVSTPVPVFNWPTSPLLVAIRPLSSSSHSGLWSTDRGYISPSADSSTQHESPTEVTVIASPSIITKAAVVPEAHASSWKSTSILTNHAITVLDKAAIHSSLPSSGGMADKTLFRRFSFEYIAAANPSCCHQYFSTLLHWWSMSVIEEMSERWAIWCRVWRVRHGW